MKYISRIYSADYQEYRTFCKEHSWTLSMGLEQALNLLDHSKLMNRFKILVTFPRTYYNKQLTNQIELFIGKKNKEFIRQLCIAYSCETKIVLRILIRLVTGNQLSEKQGGSY